MKDKNHQVAIVYDALCCRSGGERVLLDFCAAFPDAPVYTLILDTQNVYPEIRELNVKTSWFQYVTRSERIYKALFWPFGILAMETLDLTAYDVVLMVSTHCSKYVKMSPNAVAICYCFTPFRLAWNSASYRAYQKTSSWTRWIFSLIINRLRRIDFEHSQRVNHFIAMTKECEERIRQCYKRTECIPIIPPAIDCKKYRISEGPKDYYLVVSRLETYKRVDLAIGGCVKLGRKLIVVGRGSQIDNLRKISNTNVEFRQGLSDEEVAALYSNCIALIFPQHEDYGLTALEANASGRPVVAYDAGGVRDTMIAKREFGLEQTAVFFSEQTIDSLAEAILKLEATQFVPIKNRENAERFDRKTFQNRVKNEIQIMLSKAY